MESKIPGAVVRRKPQGAKSQWEFPDLFQPPADARRVFSVSELTTHVRSLLEREIGAVWVTGEITNFRLQNSGHIYFTLKDANAQLQCVLFRGEPVANRQVLEDGKKVELRGQLTVYEARGQYQLRVSAIELQGVGALQQEFERLKQKLKEEGLFAQERKRPIPRYPQRIGMATSPSGAALQDVLSVVGRRQPGLEIILAPCRVQGTGAGADVAHAIQLLNEFHASPKGRKLDLILVTRGGGSLEDLWAFNEEIVARAVFHSALPVLSAVGHEIDFTISDFVADFRAPTPSAAAEIITEGVFSSCQFVSEAGEKMRSLLRLTLDRAWKELRLQKARLIRAHPRHRLHEQGQRLDDLLDQLFRCARFHLRETSRILHERVRRLRRISPGATLERQKGELEGLKHRFLIQMGVQFRARERRYQETHGKLRLLSPAGILQRGYSITMDAETGRVLRNASEIQPGQQILTRLAQGAITSRVESATLSEGPKKATRKRRKKEV